MPSAITSDDDDPVVASYDVFLTDAPNPDATHEKRLFVLQYPSHRHSSKPYSAARLQKPLNLRVKPRTGLLEVEVPILTQEHYNVQAGHKFGTALAENRIAQSGGSHGLGGGFSTGPTNTTHSSLMNIPSHEPQGDKLLQKQTLAGKIAVPCERDPVYLLGTLRDNELHLTHLNSVVQMRPQLHHIDAEEENTQKRNQAVNSSSRNKTGLEAGPPKIETKAIELKLKDNKEDPKDRNLNVNARLLRDIQADVWKSHEWIDQDDDKAWQRFSQTTNLHHTTDQRSSKTLQSMISNDEWLDKMSAPREDGKKGLRSKLKGRDRERARRRKVEHQKRMLGAGATGARDLAGPTDSMMAEIDSDSDLSSILSDHQDTDVQKASVDKGQPGIKQEAGSSNAAAPAKIPGVPDAVPASNAAKRRGRPKKAA